MKVSRSGGSVSFVVLALITPLLGGAAASLGLCGPFTDISDAAFCPFVLEIFSLGITTGTTPTTYDPSGNVTRLQMAAFLSRGVDGVLKRGSRRAALDQLWTPRNAAALALTPVGSTPFAVRSDGTDIWVANFSDHKVFRVRAGDGKLLETWTGAGTALGVAVAMGRIFVIDDTDPGKLYRIDPTQPAGVVTTVATNLGDFPFGIAFDGGRLWTSGNGSMSIVTPGAGLPWTVTTVIAGVRPNGVLYDGANIWVTDLNAGTLLKLDDNGAILQTVTVGSAPGYPAFDGGSLWVPLGNPASAVAVVRTSNGAVLNTLTGNGLTNPFSAAFDGQRILVTNQNNGTVSLWKAADLTPLGAVVVGSGGSLPSGVCSDGLNFWITLSGVGQLARF